ncbi:MAG: hypothetical protein J0G32_00795 [Alphaproteobacteria bacterium]|nr:hypothetical protein [Alphaproteobacteria bacterium]OJV14110.1 MAG: hypothetical protein BGO27_01320 [Alphaproteobacteria bacterium 33-17]
MIKYLTPTQANKEYTINFNFALMQFLIHPVIDQIVEDLGEKLENEKAYLIINQNSPHHNHLVFINGNVTYIPPKPFMKAYFENQELQFMDTEWMYINNKNDERSRVRPTKVKNDIESLI